MYIKDLFEDKNQYIDNIKNMLMFLKIKGIRRISTNSVMQQLSNKGIEVSFEELSDVLMDNDIVSDMSTEFIEFDQPFSDEGTDDEEPSEDESREKIKQLAKSARERRRD